MPVSTDPTAEEAVPEEHPPGPVSTARSSRTLLVAYVVATFLGATLLFLVEPMVAKMLLPRLGGSPAVWNTATVFFQMALLAGYAIAHLTLSRLGPRRQSFVQLGLVAVAALTLPIAVPLGWKPPTDGSPALWTLLVLTVMVGAPFFALSTVSPTLQRWFSATTHPHAADPYFLYAAGNTGSLLALLAYPLLIEPNLSLDTQSKAWSIGYLVFVATLIGCAVLLRLDSARSVAPTADDRAATTEELVATVDADAADETAATSPAIPWRTRGRWIFLAAVPSALMLGVTHFITTDIASMPLLWVLPLSLYLLTFIIVFGRDPRRPVSAGTRIVKLLAVPLTLSFLGLISSVAFELPLHLAVFFFAAIVAHGRLSMERPAADRLTEFYLWLSVGGMIGGVLAALVAPVLFRSVLEYPIAIILSLAVLPAAAFRRGGKAAEPWRPRVPSPRAAGLAVVALVLAVVAVEVRSEGSQQALTLSILVAAAVTGGAYVLARTPQGFAGVIGLVLLVAVLVPANPTIFEQRTFFGVHRVYEDETAEGRHVLLNGRTVHGMENRVGPVAGEPETYYHRTGPIGQWFAATAGQTGPRKVGVIGLGTGALAYYGRPGDQFTYYEIDPVVIDIAQDRRLFSFIPDSRATTDFVVGDGRLELEAGDAKYDVLVGDAFSSDAIPLHLLTNEAMALYRQHLTEHGVLAFHISNRYFDFAPVLGRLAAEQGMVGLIQTNQPTEAEAAEGKLPATWVLLANDARDLAPVASNGQWEPLGTGEGAPLWTDQYADLLHVLRLEG